VGWHHRASGARRESRCRPEYEPVRISVSGIVAFRSRPMLRGARLEAGVFAGERIHPERGEDQRSRGDGGVAPPDTADERILFVAPVDEVIVEVCCATAARCLASSACTKPRPGSIGRARGDATWFRQLAAHSGRTSAAPGARKSFIGRTRSGVEEDVKSVRLADDGGDWLALQRDGGGAGGQRARTTARCRPPSPVDVGMRRTRARPGSTSECT